VAVRRSFHAQAAVKKIKEKLTNLPGIAPIRAKSIWPPRTTVHPIVVNQFQSSLPEDNVSRIAPPVELKNGERQ
jgi:hypothetical protein